MRASALGILSSTHVGAIHRLDYVPKYAVVAPFKPKHNQVCSLNMFFLNIHALTINPANYWAIIENTGILLDGPVSIPWNSWKTKY